MRASNDEPSNRTMGGRCSAPPRQPRQDDNTPRRDTTPPRAWHWNT